MNKLITIDDAMSVFDDFTRGDLDTEDVILLRDMLEGRGEVQPLRDGGCAGKAGRAHGLA